MFAISRQCRSATRLALAIVGVMAGFTGGCATSPELPDNPSAAEKLREADGDYEVHGEVGVTYGRSG